jgi:lipopolysaccharide/colanic/teichoic acid biosynthesis glycosyltransferase
MVQTYPARSTARFGFIGRLRVQLLGGFLAAVLLPALILFSSQLDRGLQVFSSYPVLGCFMGLVLGTIFYRSIAAFPGVEGSANILSSFSSSYALVAVVFLFGRYDYTRLLLLSSYLLCLGWFYFLYFLAQRFSPLRIGIVPLGSPGDFSKLTHIDWVELHDPHELRTDLNAVAADLRSDIPDDWDRRIADYALAGTPVFHSKHLMESLTGQVELEHMSENSFGTLAPAYIWLRAKRLLDIVVGLIGLVIATPVLILVAVAIRLDSPGPALFRQTRIGYRGTPFTVIKFRTMRLAKPSQSDALEEAMTKEEDARITRLGAFLRRSRIDELPQLINMIRGEMSLIGPRPEAEILSNHYEEMIPFYRYRHVVYPGITGWAQVNQGHVTNVEDVRQKLHFDFYYIKNFSPWLDLLIVAKTVRTILTGFGSR